MLLTFAFVIFINNWQNKRENRHSTVSQPVSHIREKTVIGLRQKCKQKKREKQTDNKQQRCVHKTKDTYMGIKQMVNGMQVSTTKSNETLTSHTVSKYEL